MINLKIKKLNSQAVLPFKGSDEAACLDLTAVEVVYNKDGDAVTIHLGIASEIPKGYKAVIQPRSSFADSGWVIANSPCQIDSDYRGEWKIKFKAIPKKVYSNGIGSLRTLHLNYPEFPYKPGQRVAQMSIEKVLDVNIEEVDDINDTGRGDGGFGSTGK